MKNRWTVKVEQDNFSKDYYIVLPDKLIDNMSWKVGYKLKMDVMLIGLDRILHITKTDQKKET
jgi:hypothetical protein